MFGGRFAGNANIYRRGEGKFNKKSDENIDFSQAKIASEFFFHGVSEWNTMLKNWKIREKYNFRYLYCLEIEEIVNYTIMLFFVSELDQTQSLVT